MNNTIISPLLEQDTNEDIKISKSYAQKVFDIPELRNIIWEYAKVNVEYTASFINDALTKLYVIENSYSYILMNPYKLGISNFTGTEMYKQMMSIYIKTSKVFDSILTLLNKKTCSWDTSDKIKCTLKQREGTNNYKEYAPRFITDTYPTDKFKFFTSIKAETQGYYKKATLKRFIIPKPFGEEQIIAKIKKNSILVDTLDKKLTDIIHSVTTKQLLLSLNHINAYGSQYDNELKYIFELEKEMKKQKENPKENIPIKTTEPYYDIIELEIDDEYFVSVMETTISNVFEDIWENEKTYEAYCFLKDNEVYLWKNEDDIDYLCRSVGRLSMNKQCMLEKKQIFKPEIVPIHTET